MFSIVATCFGFFSMSHPQAIHIPRPYKPMNWVIWSRNVYGLGMCMARGWLIEKEPKHVAKIENIFIKELCKTTILCTFYCKCIYSLLSHTVSNSNYRALSVRMIQGI
jgi:hypothetical protein